jgi:hypothetical protein
MYVLLCIHKKSHMRDFFDWTIRLCHAELLPVMINYENIYNSNAPLYAKNIYSIWVFQNQNNSNRSLFYGNMYLQVIPVFSLCFPLISFVRLITWEFIHGSFSFCPSCIVHTELMIQKYCELRACLLPFFI